MLELFQTEWCPSSAHVRQRLTELGIDYVVRQVSAERSERTALRAATGSDVVPTVRAEDGTIVVGEAAILTFIDDRFDEPDDAAVQRARATRARRRYLERECACLEPDTR